MLVLGRYLVLRYWDPEGIVNLGPAGTTRVAFEKRCCFGMLGAQKTI